MSIGDLETEKSSARANPICSDMEALVAAISQIVYIVIDNLWRKCGSD